MVSKNTAVTYTCTCPDYQRRHSGNPFSRGVTGSIPQQWEDTVRNGYCKHIYAVLIMRRELDFDSIPSDIPIDEKIRRPQKTGYKGIVPKNTNPFNGRRKN